MDEEKDSYNDLKLESCKAILDTAKVVYSEELDRYKISETKTQILLAFTGIVFSFYINFLLKIESEKSLLSILIYWVFNLMIFLLLGFAVKCLIQAITMVKFEQVNVEELTRRSLASKEERFVIMQIAATYRNVIRENKALIEAKMDSIKDAIWYLKWAVSLIIIYIFIREVLGVV